MGCKVKTFDFGVWAVNAKQTLLILSFFHTLQYVVNCASAQSTQGENDREIPNIPSSQLRTWDVTPNSENVDLYTSLIDILEKLDIVPVPENTSACMTLGKIVREVEPVTSSSISKHVKITFQFTETIHSTKTDGSAQNVNSFTDINTHTYSVGGLKSPKCNKSSSFLTQGLDSLSRKQESDNGANAVLNVDVDKETNKTGAVPMTLDDEKEDKTEEKGLSRTQIVVISTCSAVIGLFFLIAGALRIRNYYKRYRIRRENNVNGNRQGSSLRLPSSTNSSGNLRRDSNGSKASRQSHTNIKGGGDGQIARQDKNLLFPQPSPALATTDQKPLLPANCQISQNSNGSSHGSIAYIDEDTSSRIKTSDVNDDGSDDNEDFPLLRKSPDSGSYVSLEIYSDKDQKQEAFCPSTEDIERDAKRKPSEESEHQNEDKCDGVQPLNMVSYDIDPKSKFDDLSQKDSAIDGNKNPAVHGSVPDMADSVDNNGTVLEETFSGNESENIGDSCVVNIGLNQSDSSISENPSYSYGNQTEYSPYTSYGPDNFSPQEDNIIKDYLLQLACLDDSKHISNFLENESDYRENGSFDRVANEMSAIQSDQSESPESLIPLIKGHATNISGDGVRTDNHDTCKTYKNTEGLESSKDSTESWAVVPHQPVRIADRPIV